LPPGSCHAVHIVRPAKFTVVAHFTGHAPNFRSEAVELIHHRIDRVLQLEDFAAHVHRNFLGKVTVGDCGRNFGDVAHLAGKIAGHQIHAVSKVLPGTGDAFDVSLAAKFSFRAHLAGDAGNFRGETVELI